MMSDALDVIGALITEDGRPWAEAAVDVQVEDMNAWLCDERPYHYATRSRGFSKSADAAALALGEARDRPADARFLACVRSGAGAPRGRVDRGLRAAHLRACSRARS